jgi:hypothetical protein
VFPETVNSPPIVPETIDEEAPVPARKMMGEDETLMLVDCVSVTEFVEIEYVPAAPPATDAGRAS